MKLSHIFGALLALLLIVLPVAAGTAYEGASRGLTAQGPAGILVSLGIENFGLTLEWVTMLYAMIAIAILFFIGSMASQRNSHYFAIILVIFAGLFFMFGWLKDPDPTNNPGQMFGLILISAIIAVAYYMKRSNRDFSGSGGPGSTLMNLVYFMVFLQVAVGVVNTTAIWNTTSGVGNTAINSNQFSNVQLAPQMNGISNTGGLMEDAIATSAALMEASIMILKTILSIIITVAAFSVTIVTVFPWLFGNPIAMALLAALQVMIWAAYAWFIFTIFYKPMPDGGYL